MSIFKRAMDYLGLGADEAYDDYDVPEETDRPMRGQRRDEGPRRTVDPHADYYEDLGARPPRQTLPSRDIEPVPVRRSPGNDDSSVQPRPSNPRQGSNVRAIPPAVSATEPHTVRPRRFDQAQEVADRFKDGMAVIMNLESTERDVSRRLIDFASGLCYALNGSMEKVATGVYLLKPPSRASYDNGGERGDYGV